MGVCVRVCVTHTVHIYIRCVECTLRQIHYLYRFIPVTVSLSLQLVFSHVPSYATRQTTGRCTVHGPVVNQRSPTVPSSQGVPSSVTSSHHLLVRPLPVFLPKRCHSNDVVNVFFTSSHEITFAVLLYRSG